ncbi:MAG: hypothetical protein GEU89_07440 [Kiloniellaceae bacterium]|jgi:polyferredoxin|nr:hypothetical protein [Kiloniellaceae bacterium]
MSLDPETRRWLKDWAVKVGATAYLLFVFAFMAGHAAPGSIASLSHALVMAIVPAAIGSLAVLAVMLYLRRR